MIWHYKLDRSMSILTFSFEYAWYSDINKYWLPQQTLNFQLLLVMISLFLYFSINLAKHNDSDMQDVFYNKILKRFFICLWLRGWIYMSDAKRISSDSKVFINEIMKFKENVIVFNSITFIFIYTYIFLFLFTLF